MRKTNSTSMLTPVLMLIAAVLMFVAALLRFREPGSVSWLMFIAAAAFLLSAILQFRMVSRNRKQQQEAQSQPRSLGWPGQP